MNTVEAAPIPIIRNNISDPIDSNIMPVNPIEIAVVPITAI